MFDLISIGDAVIDTFVPLLDAEVETSHGGNERKLCLPYGDKIPVGASLSLVAGNAANNAVGSSRLKLKTAIYVNVGGDSDGEDIKKELEREGVDLRYAKINRDLPTNRHVVLDFKGERTILVYHQPWDYSLPDLEKTRWVYLTSLSPTFSYSPLVEQITRFLERTGARLSYNPGTFQIQLGVKKNPQLLALTEVLIVNKEEAKLILGYKEADEINIKKLLKGLADLGPRMVVITDGKAGSFGFDGQTCCQLGIFPAKVVEVTGAGDAYATGLLAGLFYGKELPEAMRWGAANGAAVVEQIGPQAGLLSYEKMEERLKENSQIKVRELR